MVLVKIIIRILYIVFIPGLFSALIMMFISGAIVKPLYPIRRARRALNILIPVLNLYLLLLLGAYSYLFISHTILQYGISTFGGFIIHLPLVALLVKIAKGHYDESANEAILYGWDDPNRFNRGINGFIPISYVLFGIFPGIIQYIFPAQLKHLASLW